MADPSDPTGIGQGLADPLVSSMIDRYRQYALMQQIAGAQQSVGNPSNRGEGLTALGKGFTNMLTGFAMAHQNQMGRQMGQALGNRIGNMPTSTMPPLVLGNAGTPGATPAFNKIAGDLPGMVPPPSAPGVGGQIVPEFDPQNKAPGLQPRLADYAQDTLQDAAAQGVNAHIISGYRSPEEQAKLVAGGSYAAQPGQSRHQYGAAFDYQPDNPSTNAYNIVNENARNLGLTAGADFRRPDIDHLQLPGSLAQAQAGFAGGAPAPMQLAGPPPTPDTNPRRAGPVTPEQSSLYAAALQHGATPAGATAIVAAMSGESGRNLNTAFGQDVTHGVAEAAYGIPNWNFDRMKNQQAWARGLGMDPLSRPAQEGYLFTEMQNKYPGVWNAVTNPNMNSAGALRTVVNDYLAPGDKATAYNARVPFLAADYSGTGPKSYGVPANMVAGPGAPMPVPRPSDVEPTTQEGRLAAMTGAPMPPPRPPETQDLTGTAQRLMADQRPIAPTPAAPMPVARPGQTPVILPNQTPAVVPPGATSSAPTGPPSQFQPVMPNAPMSSPLSPTPMGPPSVFSPPGAGPGAAAPAVAPPVSPPVMPPQPVGPPPVAARPPALVPATGGSAYDPRTGRFLAPGEQIPGYAPAPMSSTGGGGLGGLLSSIFGGGTAQAAPASRGLGAGLGGGASPPPPGVGRPVPPIYAPDNAQIPGYGIAPPGGAPVPTPRGAGPVLAGGAAPPAGAAPPPAASASGNTLIGPLADRYKMLSAQHDQLMVQARQLDVAAQYAAGTPYEQAYHQQAATLREQANQARTDANAAQADIIKFQQEEQIHARTLGEETWRGATPAEVAAHGGNPVDARFYETNGKGDFKTAPDYVKPEFKQTGIDIQGNPKYEWVRPPGQGGPAAPAAVPMTAPATPAVPSATAPSPAATAPAAVPAAGLPTPAEVSALIDKGRAAGLKGEDLLKTLPPMIADHARAIAAGDEPMPDSGMAGSRPVNQSINDAVRAAFPGTSAQEFAIRGEAKRAFAPGGKDQETILKLNSAVEHSANQLAAGHALGTGDSAIINRAENAIAGAGSERGIRLADFNTVSGLAGPELQSIYTPTGGSGGERAEQSGTMNATQSPAQMEAVHKSRMEAVAARITALDDQYNKAMGPNAPPWSGLTPGALSEVQKYANDRLPDRLQARDEITGKPLAPASLENKFTYGQPQPAWADPFNRMVAPGTAQLPQAGPAVSPGLGYGPTVDSAYRTIQEHPYASGAAAFPAGIALGAGGSALGPMGIAKVLGGGYLLNKVPELARIFSGGR